MNRIQFDPDQLSLKSALVVDDSADSLILLRAVLEMDGFRVSTAPTGEKALEGMSGGNKPNLILLDVNLGDMSGPEFLKRLGGQRPDVVRDVPIIYYTGAEIPPFDENTGFIRKSGNVEDLLKEVHHFMNLKGRVA